MKYSFGTTCSFDIFIYWSLGRPLSEFYAMIRPSTVMDRKEGHLLNYFVLYTEDSVVQSFIIVSYFEEINLRYDRQS